jgi:phage terminase large subunit
MRAQFPDKLEFLFRPCRFKVARGGRGSGKSWGFARALLLLAARQPLRVLCTREIQNSIKDSVHRLLSDQISALGLQSLYEIQNDQIIGPNGSLFLFSGLHQQTVDSIKSFEGVDIVWVEEAQSVVKRSWDVLIPTIRRPNSEIWVTFNPDLDTDDTYQRFVVNPPEGRCISIEMNFSDNPWFPDELEQERQHCARTRPNDYPNIWLGKCRSVVDGAIYADEVRDLLESGRHGFVPYDPTLKVHAIFDLGWNDLTAIILAQRNGPEMRVIRYIEDNRRRLDQYSADLRDFRYNWGKVFLPHDGTSGNIVSGTLTPRTTMESLGWEVEILPRLDPEDGIRLAREMFPRTRIDKNQAGPLVERLRRYRRHINKVTREPGAPLHDENSHGADVWRYLAMAAPQMVNEEWGGALNYRKIGTA